MVLDNMDELMASISLEGINVTSADVLVSSSVTVIVCDATSGPVSAIGHNVNPFRKHASAAATAIGPGIPLTITCSDLLIFNSNRVDFVFNTKLEIGISPFIITTKVIAALYLGMFIVASVVYVVVIESS